MSEPKRLLLSGNEAVALAARDAGVALGTGYPGTPSTEILEHLPALGGRPNGRPTKKWRWRSAWAWPSAAPRRWSP